MLITVEASLYVSMYLWSQCPVCLRKKGKGHVDLKQDKGFLLTSFRLAFGVLGIFIFLLESLR